MYVKVRKVPLPVGLPFFWFPQKQERSHGILFPSFGNGQELGFFIKDLGWYEPLGEHWDARIMGDLYSRGRGGYPDPPNTATATASMATSLCPGRASSRAEPLGIPGLPRTEFFVRWSHNQDPKARPNGRFNANVNFGSAGNFRSQLNSTRRTSSPTVSLRASTTMPPFPASL